MRPSIRRMLSLAILAGIGFAAGTVSGLSATAKETPAPSVEALLETGVTILGQPLAYPSTERLTLPRRSWPWPRGVKTGLHRHEGPLFAHVLSGELTVTYEGAGARVYRTGEHAAQRPQ